MGRILNMFGGQRKAEAFEDHEALITALGNEESRAIKYIGQKVSGSVYKIGKQVQLTDEDIEELICDVVVAMIQKIQSGAYVYQGFDPASFVIEMAKNKAYNYRRSRMRHHTEDLDLRPEEGFELPDFTYAEQTDMLLQKIDPNCQRLIRLKYLEEYRDKDVIEEFLTQYTTVDALKNHRAKCMKKLSSIAAGMNQHIF